MYLLGWILYSDAIKHEFKEIDKNYSVLKAQSDIKTILSSLESDFEISLPDDVKGRVKSI
ncbi:hypothetical protein LV84_04297 [Algoriphagus ratkowskyi]|uniref:Uncharacterized protein n=1 Tax=Algoriphagus ratkowskyi TaxID=57028 RepID=A0A2W7QSI7_9BACT|nr:hypothetical protein LV84_04297 [Algoriphagus ratkowskyi]